MDSENQSKNRDALQRYHLNRTTIQKLNIQVLDIKARQLFYLCEVERAKETYCQILKLKFIPANQWIEETDTWIKSLPIANSAFNNSAKEETQTMHSDNPLQCHNNEINSLVEEYYRAKKELEIGLSMNGFRS